jgi:dihydroorotase
MFDLLIAGGEVVDPSQGLNGPADVGIRDGLVAAVGPGLAEPARERIDARGSIVTPGLIDLHAHVYAGATSWGLKPDPVCLATGVTTIVDAGSAGWSSLAGFRWYIAEPAATRVLCYLHISGIGLIYAPVGEMLNLAFADPESVGQHAAENRDLVVGIKIRQGTFQVGEHGTRPLELAIEAAEIAGLPVMCHIAEGPPLPQILQLLRPGDVVTHCFQGRGEPVVDPQGALLPAAQAARERGVVMDVGHGGGSFRWEIAEAALDRGYLPDVISTDLHTYNRYGPVYDLPTTLSKFLHLGLTLEQVIERATLYPARALRRTDLGTLRPGSPADVALFTLEEGEFSFRDAHGGTRAASRRLAPRLTVRAGRVHHPEELVQETQEELARRSRPRRPPGAPTAPGRTGAGSRRGGR